ncbi:MAG: ATP-binding protein [Elusimicrobiota bacterium]
MQIQREFVSILESRLKEPSPLIQVILGPRQVGKTTGIHQYLTKTSASSLYVSADDTLSASYLWIQEQWQKAQEKGPGTVFIVDEIQKIENWSGIIKKLWDAQQKSHRLKCVLLGSSSISLQSGLTESLTGRFELIPVSHWNYEESNQAFQLDLETYMRFGGYPGTYPYIHDFPRWFSLMKSSIIDTVIGQDILTQQTVSKPALFKQAFEILCGYPGQEVSYTRLLGQLHDKGNTDLVKHYLELYEGAYLFKKLEKYSSKTLITKGSSPKIIPLCPAFYTLATGPEALNDPEKKGHVFEAIVGADLLRIPGGNVFYWREGNNEVDYVFKIREKIFGIEVKSARKRQIKGLQLFSQRFKNIRTCIINMENYLRFSHNPLTFLEEFSI